MTDEPHGNGADQDAGEPVEMLRNFQEDVSPEFLGRVHRSIHRRTVAAQVADFSWRTPGMILLELSKMLRQVLTAAAPGKGPGK
jgi:hypothetical protein